jgi:hypothetical protein
MLKKIALVTVAAATLAVSSFATVETASAQPWGWGAAGFGAGLLVGTAVAGAYAQPVYGHQVCDPVFRTKKVWNKYTYSYQYIQVRVGSNCYWVNY